MEKNFSGKQGWTYARKVNNSCISNHKFCLKQASNILNKLDKLISLLLTLMPFIQKISSKNCLHKYKPNRESKQGGVNQAEQNVYSYSLHTDKTKSNPTPHYNRTHSTVKNRFPILLFFFISTNMAYHHIQYTGTFQYMAQVGKPLNQCKCKVM